MQCSAEKPWVLSIYVDVLGLVYHSPKHHCRPSTCPNIKMLLWLIDVSGFIASRQVMSFPVCTYLTNIQRAEQQQQHGP